MINKKDIRFYTVIFLAGLMAVAMTFQSGFAGERVKGRNLVRIGNVSTLEGTLFKVNAEEWTLQVGDVSYDLHMGPTAYRDCHQFVLKEGSSARVKGAVYNTDVGVMQIEAMGQSITLRDEFGRPVWGASSYSKRDFNPVESRAFMRSLLRGDGVALRQRGFINEDLVGYDHIKNLLENIENGTATAEEFIGAITNYIYSIEHISASSVANYMEAIANEGLLELIPSQYFSDKEIKTALDVVFENRSNILANWNVFEDQWLASRI